MVQLATGKREVISGIIPGAAEEEVGKSVNEEVGVNVLADLERQGQEGGRRVHPNERARILDNKSMMGIKRIYCQLIFLAESWQPVAY